jgi:ABC-2 type transport system permease protein
MRNLFTKTLYDKRFFILGWGLGMVLFGFLMTIFYPSFSDSSSLASLVKNLPPALQSLVGNLSNLNTLSTYLGSQLFNVRVPIFISILSIILSVGLTVGEEDRGQIRTLLSLPLSRRRIIVSKWFIIVTICLIATIMTAVGIEIGLLTIHDTLDMTVLLRLCSVMWLFSVSLATIIFGIGLATGSRGFTTGMGVLIAVGSFILTTFSPSVSWLGDYEKFSLLHYFPAADIAKGTVDPLNIIVYSVIIVVFLVIAFVAFRRRDVR